MNSRTRWTQIPRLLFVAAFTCGVALLAVPNAAGQNLPALPQKTVDTTYPAKTGQDIYVSAGGDFQSALDMAQPGDVIHLKAGSTYNGPFTLRPKSGTGWIVVRTSAADSSLPPQGTRITPSYASVMPKIVARDAGPALQTAAGAHHYRFVGVEFTITSGLSFNYGVVLCGSSGSQQDASSEVPYNIIFDRVYVHGSSTANVRRGITLNCATAAVIDSYISDIHEIGADSQAIGGWNGPGPFKIANNYLEGAGENVMFGGGDPSISNLVPSDIEVRGNHFFKPLKWKVGHPTYAGKEWSVKNIFELKNARRVLIDGNIFEHNWPHAQNGFSILFTVRNQDGSAPWSTVEDVTFTNNIVRHVASAVNILGYDNNNPSQQTKRILIKNNLFEDVNANNWGGTGRLFQILSGTADITIDHNTAFQTGEIINADGSANSRFVYRNNLTPHNQYGVGGSGTYGNPLKTLSTYFPGAVFVRNILQGGNAASYPPDNFFPATMADVQFVDYAGKNYRLNSTSPYNNAGTDGKDVGADIDAVENATRNAVTGKSGSTPPPSDTTPPSVTITAPANGSKVANTITVAATASDNVGVTGVKFFVDGKLIGIEDTSAPYETPWNTTTVANGSHTLTAVARDAAGNTTTSSAVDVDVSNTGPITEQSPYSGSPFQAPGRLEAEDFDKGGEGVAYHDLVAGNQGGAYRTSEDVDIIALSAGGYAVNNFQTDEWLEYTINAPRSATYTIEALVSTEFDGTQLRIEIDGNDVTGALAVPNTGWWKTFQYVGKSGISLSAGQHVVRLVAVLEFFDVDAIRFTEEAPAGDTTAPTVAITSPANDATVSKTLSVTADASDNVGVTGVQFYLDGAVLGAEDTTAPYATSWDTTKTANGSHTLTAVARDAAGNSTTSAPVTVTVSNPAPDTTAPTVSITSPGSGTTVSQTVSVTATASDNVGVIGVQFYLDGAVLGAEDTTAPYATSWDTTKSSNGSHTLTAVARDAAGNSTTSGPVTVTVSNVEPDTTPPSVSITSPSNGATVSGTINISANASDNVGVSGVRFYVDGALIGSEVTSAPYQVSWNTTTVADGSHNLTAVARDAAGNTTTSAAVVVTVANAPPAQQTPFTGAAFKVPGEFQAEDFDKGGQGVAYHDMTAGNKGNQYRTTEDVDIIKPAVGRYAVNNFQTGEWLEYTISVTTPGTYMIEALVSSEVNTSAFHVEIDNRDVTGSIAVPNTGRWKTFRYVGKGGIALSPGEHVLRVVSDMQYFNFDALRITSTPPPANPQSPFYGSPMQAPARFEAEDFDKGGEGIAYHDHAPGNAGGKYRTDEDVDIIALSAGGHAVNNFETGEWIEYTINVTASGTYTVEALVSSEFATSRLHIEIDGVDVTGSLAVPNTGSWGSFQYVGKPGVSISAGQHIVRIEADQQYFNLDALRIRQ